MTMFHKPKPSTDPAPMPGVCCSCGARLGAVAIDTLASSDDSNTAIRSTDWVCAACFERRRQSAGEN
jgi:hypothetical protein